MAALALVEADQLVDQPLRMDPAQRVMAELNWPASSLTITAPFNKPCDITLRAPSVAILGASGRAIPSRCAIVLE